jgi:hypothetical protein
MDKGEKTDRWHKRDKIWEGNYFPLNFSRPIPLVNMIMDTTNIHGLG